MFKQMEVFCHRSKPCVNRSLEQGLFKNEVNIVYREFSPVLTKSLAMDRCLWANCRHCFVQKWMACNRSPLPSNNGKGCRRLFFLRRIRCSLLMDTQRLSLSIMSRLAVRYPSTFLVASNATKDLNEAMMYILINQTHHNQASLTPGASFNHPRKP